MRSRSEAVQATRNAALACIIASMKVLHVADFLPGLHKVAGGAEYAAGRVIEEQLAAGLEVEVATLPRDVTRGPTPWQRHWEVRNVDRFAARAAYAVKQLYFPFDPLARRDLDQVLAESRPDVVHFHNLHFMGLAVVGAPRAAGIPSVWSVYDYWLFCPSFMLLTNGNELCTRGHGAWCVDCVGTRRLRALKPVKRALFAMRARAFAHPAGLVDRFVVLSNASRELLIQHGVADARVQVIPQYVWREAMRDETPAQPVPGRLLYVGWVEKRKGLDIVVRALARVADRYPALHLDVLGLPADAEYADDVQRFVREAGLAERVRFRGRTERSALLRALREAFVVTIPEQWENMSPVILTEAMAAGACPLASRVGGIRHFVEEGTSGLLAARDDVDEWAARLAWAMEHATDVAAMGRAARARARAVFETESITRQTISLYDAVRAAASKEGIAT
jgi:glycosyltransferase involved in cell wall biosynthesis